MNRKNIFKILHLQSNQKKVQQRYFDENRVSPFTNQINGTSPRTGIKTSFYSKCGKTGVITKYCCLKKPRIGKTEIDGNRIISVITTPQASMGNK